MEVLCLDFENENFKIQRLSRLNFAGKTLVSSKCPVQTTFAPSVPFAKTQSRRHPRKEKKKGIGEEKRSQQPTPSLLTAPTRFNKISFLRGAFD